jgi:hypothetical protein
MGWRSWATSARPTARILATPEVALIAWIHILAFDHLVGVVIYRDNMRHRVVPVPVQSVILFLTLMFGPIGFLAYWLARIAKRRAFIDDAREGGGRTGRGDASVVGHDAPSLVEREGASVLDAGRTFTSQRVRRSRRERDHPAPLREAVPRPDGPLPVALARTLMLLWSRAPVLAAVGALGVVVAAGMALAALVRGNAVGPEGNLFETATFDVALGIYVLTLAALSPLAAFTPRGRRTWIALFSTLVLVAYAIETVQAFRGLDPRFSAVAGPIDQAVGSFFLLVAQGVMICAFVVFWKFFSPATAHLPHALRLAVRYGALASVVAFGIGDVMSVVGGRTLGDAGNLLPLHAAGFHGVQAVPLVALLLVWAQAPADTARRSTHLAGGAWLLACIAIAAQSLGGRALLGVAPATVLAAAALSGWAAIAIRAVARAHSDSARTVTHEAA